MRTMKLHWCKSVNPKKRISEVGYIWKRQRSSWEWLSPVRTTTFSRLRVKVTFSPDGVLLPSVRAELAILHQHTEQLLCTKGAPGHVVPGWHTSPSRRDHKNIFPIQAKQPHQAFGQFQGFKQASGSLHKAICKIILGNDISIVHKTIWLFLPVVL